MTLTELKVKLAEQCLPVGHGTTIASKDGHGIVKFEKQYDYELAEQIVNFLIANGVNLEE